MALPVFYFTVMIKDLVKLWVGVNLIYLIWYLTIFICSPHTVKMQNKNLSTNEKKIFFMKFV